MSIKLTKLENQREVTIFERKQLKINALYEIYAITGSKNPRHFRLDKIKTIKTTRNKLILHYFFISNLQLTQDGSGSEV